MVLSSKVTPERQVLTSCKEALLLVLLFKAVSLLVRDGRIARPGVFWGCFNLLMTLSSIALVLGFKFI